MNIAFLCILIMGLMPFLFTAIAKFSGKGFDNNAPREFLAKLDGYRARANWAHQNCFEAFPFFAAAVLVAVYNNAPQVRLEIIAILIVVLRLIYGVLYIMDKASLRSLVWFIALALMISLFFI